MQLFNLKKFIQQKYPILLIIALIIAVLAYGQVTRQESAEQLPPDDGHIIEGESVAQRFYRVIDGVEVASEQETREHLAAVMIENNSESWPLAGIEDASIVYEVLTEGRIPRFLALFVASAMPDKIGPVRSARTYYLELADPFDAPYLHVGGSPDALEKIKLFDILDVDQFFWSSYFWRATNRFAPHNVYTSGSLFAQLIEDREIPLPEFRHGWKFIDAAQEIFAGQDVEDIVVNYTTSTYQAKYVYDEERGQYQRYQAKQPMVTETADGVWVDTVIVEEHLHHVYDAVGRRRIDIVGEGKAWVFFKGQMHVVTWKRSARNELTRYYDEQGDELMLQPGKIWINIVEPGVFKL